MQVTFYPLPNHLSYIVCLTKISILKYIVMPTKGPFLIYKLWTITNICPYHTVYTTGPELIKCVLKLYYLKLALYCTFNEFWMYFKYFKCIYVMQILRRIKESHLSWCPILIVDLWFRCFFGSNARPKLYVWHQRWWM